MTVGDRIKKRRKQLNLTVDDLAKKLNKNRATIYRYESDEIENMPLTILEPLAEALSVSPAYLMGWDDTKEHKLTFDYPYYPVSISAGQPIEVNPVMEKDIETITLPDSVMGKWAGSKDIFIMRVNGDSMNNIISHNSLIAVKKVELSQLKDKNIVVYSDGSSYAVKRFYNNKKDGELIFRPDSKDNNFTDHVVPYDKANNIIIHGKVVVYIVELD